MMGQTSQTSDPVQVASQVPLRCGCQTRCNCNPAPQTGIALPIYGGPTKRQIVQQAYEECGLSDYSYTLSPEDYDSALQKLDALMREWEAEGICLNYNFSDYGAGDPDDESGIPFWSQQAATLKLATRLSPKEGRGLTAESKGALAMSMKVLRARFVCAPPMRLGSYTPKGAGNRWARAPFFSGRQCW